MGRLVNVFADSNYFMHFKDPTACDWKALFGADVSEVRVLVGRQVQKELDTKRYSVKGRAQDRARKYAKLLVAVATSQMPHEYRASGPRLVLNFVARSESFTPPAALDDARQDDQVIGDILAFNAENVGHEAVLLTDDAGIILRAKGFGVQVFSIPDGWELEAEADETEKENQRLKRENSELQRKGPALSVALKRDGAAVPAMLAETWWMPALTTQQKDALIEEVDRRWPLQENLRELPAQPPANGGHWAAPSVEEISRYRTQHSSWRAGLVSELDKAVADNAGRTVHLEFDLNLVNSGVEPAEHLRVVFELDGPFTFVDRPQDEEDDEPIALTGPGEPLVAATKIALPPSPPQPQRVAPVEPAPPIRRTLTAAKAADSLMGYDRLTEKLLRQARGMHGASGSGMLGQLDRLTGRASMGQRSAADIVRADYVYPIPRASAFAGFKPLRTNRDPQKFYWITEKRNGVTRWEFECERFVHSGEPEVFDLIVAADISSADALVGQFRVSVTAKNQRKTLAEAFNIRVQVTELDRAEHIRKALP